jgi:hypothetical protein
MSSTRNAGIIAAAVGGALFLGGAALTSIHATQRDPDGYYSTSSIPVQSHGYAITSEKLGIEGIDGDLARSIVGQVRVRVEPDGSAPLFVGIASKRSVDRYLDGVERSVVDDLDEESADLTDHAGDRLPAPPAGERFWHASSTGSGAQMIDWKPRNGDWRVVVMNASGSSGVDAHLKVGAKSDLLLWIGLPLLGLGLIGLFGGGALIVAGRSRTGVPTGEDTDVTSAA